MRRLIAGVVVAAALAAAQGSFAVGGLRCEYLANPMGIDVAKPRLSWMLSPSPGRSQSAYRVLVSSSPALLQQDKGDLWDSGKVASEQTTFVPYAGNPLVSGERVWWKVRAWDEHGLASASSETARWSMGLLNASDWHARWIGLPRPQGFAEGKPLPFPWLRRSFTLDQKAQRATAYVNTLGYYELYVNGKKVDDYVLAPAVADYSKRNWYLTHDITEYLIPGRNVIALWLGRGWYAKGNPGVMYDGPLVRAQFDIALPGGQTVQLETDGAWKAKTSPIMPLGRGTPFGDYGGEAYDARLEIAGWNSGALDDSGWSPAAVLEPPNVATGAQMVEPNRILETLRPVKIDRTPGGGWLIDMGKNYTGWLDLRLPANTEAGRNIKLEFADAPPTPGHYSTYRQRDEYVTRAGAGQVVRSRFNYHAFRYAHVTGLASAPTAADVQGDFIRTSYGRAGAFESSNELLNRIYKMVTWTYECLTLGGYVVDCPTRERLGYGGDAGTSIENGLFNFATGGLYNRWAANWRDAQDPHSGDLPYTAPNYPDVGGGGPMWSGFVVTMPWQVYLNYGDKGILETNYPMMRNWLAFADSKTRDHLLEPYISIGIRMPEWNYLGDWVTPHQDTGIDPARNPVSARFINNAHYLYTLQLAAKIAGVLGKPEDAAMYAERAATLARALHERFYDKSHHSYATGEQPYPALALLLGIVPPDLRAGVMQSLEEQILVKTGGHFDSGMHGTYFLLKELMAEGRNDLIYQMTSKKEFPGWGYMLAQGGTTSWESWSDESHIHDTLISIGAWFIEGIGGIRADEKAPGFRHFFLKPAPVGDLTFAHTRYESVHGTIVSNWQIENATLHLDVTVPPGTSATLYLPDGKQRELSPGSYQIASKWSSRNAP